MSQYLEQRRMQKITGVVPSSKKPPKPIAKKSAKKIEQEKAEKGDDKEKWFQARRKEMIGYCTCGCGQKSSKDDDVNFRSSIAHLLPKKTFKSVQFHRLNWIERNFWDGCHSNFDNLSVERWVNMEDWPVIKERFLVLAPLLTPEEKATKFYANLESLVSNN